MTINFKCPSCRKAFKLSNKLAGRKARCPDCGSQFNVPNRNAATTQKMRGMSDNPFGGLDEPSDGDDDYTPNYRRRRGFFSQLFGCLFLLVLLLVAAVGGAYAALYLKLINRDLAEPYLAKVPFKIPGLTTGPNKGDSTAPEGTAKADAGQGTAKENTEAKKEDPSGLPPEYRFLPDKFALLVSVNVEAVLGSKLYEKLKSTFAGNLDIDEASKGVIGLPVSGVRRVIVGSHTKDDTITIVLTKEPITADAIKNNLKEEFKETKVGKYVMYEGKKNIFSVVDDRTVVGAETAEPLKKVLERDKPPETVPDLLPIFKKITDAKAISLAVGPQDLIREARKASTAIEEFKPPPELQPLFDAQAFDIQIELTSGLEISATLQCKNTGDAEALKKTADDYLQKLAMAKLDQSAKDALQAIKLGVSGDSVAITVAVSDDTVAGAIQAVMLLAKAFMQPPKQ